MTKINNTISNTVKITSDNIKLGVSKSNRQFHHARADIKKKVYAYRYLDGSYKVTTQWNPEDSQGVSGVKFKSFPSHDHANEWLAAISSNASKPAISSNKKVMQIYTDGACFTKNSNRYAGGGVWFGRDDSRNMSISDIPIPHTNQRAELFAVLAALRWVSNDLKLQQHQQLSNNNQLQHYEILTDSQYTIGCVTEWSISWKKEPWWSKSGESFSAAGGRKGPAKNLDIIQPAVALYDILKPHVTLKWVKGHAGIEGNEGADKLANEGALVAMNS